jgi:hypothetical protein
MRVDLGGGQWAELKDAEQVTNGDRRHALSKWGALADDERTVAVVGKMAILDGFLERLVVGWSFEMPLPSVDAESLGQLPLEASNKLYAAVNYLDGAAVPDFSPSTDPKVGTPSSGD